jgi:cell pole-organizing protein PopZ
MSVAASVNEPTDPEILRAQRAHEPSMEEILASIRAIIADDRDPAPKPQIVYSSDAPRTADEPEPEPEPEPLRLREDAPPPEPARVEEEPLISEETEATVAASFQSLADSMAAYGREVAADMAREMLKPMLKEWLDANLPPLVERLVKAEIARVTRGRK